MEKGKVLLKVKGNLIGVFPTTPAIQHLLEPVATFRYRESRRGGKSAFVDRKLYNVDDSGTFEVLAGLESRVVKRLQAYGFKVLIQRLSKKTFKPYFEGLTPKDLDELQERNDQVDVIGLVADSPRGFVVDCPTGWGKSYAIPKICKVLPSSRIAVVAPGIDVTRGIYDNMRRQISGVGLVCDGYASINRVTVCTMESIDKLAKGHWDLLLFDEAHRAGGPATAQAIAEIFYDTKCVGFSASPHGRSDNADLVVEALFGPVAYKVTYSEAVAMGSIVPLKVLMFDSTVGNAAAAGTPTERNRLGLWENDARNELIARIARSIPDDEQTLVMVSTAQHALALKRKLPEYSVIFSQASNTEKLEGFDISLVPGLKENGSFDTAVRAAITNDFSSGVIKKAISTGVWNTGVSFNQLRFLIRAEGAASKILSIQTPGRLSRKHAGKEYGVLIDFMDRFDSALQKRSSDRLRSYRKIGWEVLTYADMQDKELVALFKEV